MYLEIVCCDRFNVQNDTLEYARSYAGSVANNDGNLWVLGGKSSSKLSAKTTEIYEWKDKKYVRGQPLPSIYEHTGLQNQCVLRYCI